MSKFSTWERKTYLSVNLPGTWIWKYSEKNLSFTPIRAFFSSTTPFSTFFFSTTTENSIGLLTQRFWPKILNCWMLHFSYKLLREKVKSSLDVIHSVLIDEKPRPDSKSYPGLTLNCNGQRRRPKNSKDNGISKKKKVKFVNWLGPNPNSQNFRNPHPGA